MVDPSRRWRIGFLFVLFVVIRVSRSYFTEMLVGQAVQQQLDYKRTRVYQGVFSVIVNGGRCCILFAIEEIGGLLCSYQR